VALSSINFSLILVILGPSCAFRAYCISYRIPSNIGTKCNSLIQQFIRISTTIDIWATCFDSIESSSGPQRLQIQLLQGGQVHCGIPNAYIIVP